MHRTPKRLQPHLLVAMMEQHSSKNPTIGVLAMIGKHGKGSISVQGSGCSVHLIPMMFSQNG